MYGDDEFEIASQQDRTSLKKKTHALILFTGGFGKIWQKYGKRSAKDVRHIAIHQVPADLSERTELFGVGASSRGFRTF